MRAAKGLSCSRRLHLQLRPGGCQELQHSLVFVLSSIHQLSARDDNFTAQPDLTGGQIQTILQQTGRRLLWVLDAGCSGFWTLAAPGSVWSCSLVGETQQLWPPKPVHCTFYVSCSLSIENYQFWLVCSCRL